MESFRSNIAKKMSNIRIAREIIVLGSEERQRQKLLQEIKKKIIREWWWRRWRTCIKNYGFRFTFYVFL
jgi:hypothetical protein